MGKELLDAAKSGNFAAVRRRLDEGADINFADRGETALCFAARGGHADIIKLLLNQGAKVSDPDIVDPMIFAIFQGDSAIALLLLQSGSDPNLVDKHGNSLVSVASADGEKEIVSALIAYKADLNIANQDGMTPLINAVVGGHSDLVAMLITAGAHINHRNSYDMFTNGGATALILAAYLNRLDIVEQLVRAGADVTVEDAKGRTALSHAVAKGNDSIAAFLEKTAKKGSKKSVHTFKISAPKFFAENKKLVFYPGAGTDLHDIAIFKDEVSCFVHADYKETPDLSDRLEADGFRVIHSEELTFQDLKETVGLSESDGFYADDWQKFANTESVRNGISRWYVFKSGRNTLGLLQVFGEAHWVYEHIFANRNKAAFGILLHDHSLGGGWARFGGHSRLYDLAEANLPEWLVVAETTSVWSGYDRSNRYRVEVGGQHRTERLLWRIMSDHK